MQLPFTGEQFFEVFHAYNTALWPAQVLLLASVQWDVPAKEVKRLLRERPKAIGLVSQHAARLAGNGWVRIRWTSRSVERVSC